MGFYPHGQPPPFGGYHAGPPPMHPPMGALGPPPGMLHHGLPPMHPPPLGHPPMPPPHGPPHGYLPPPHAVPPHRPFHGGPPPPGYGHGYPGGPPPGDYPHRPWPPPHEVPHALPGHGGMPPPHQCAAPPPRPEPHAVVLAATPAGPQSYAPAGAPTRTPSTGIPPAVSDFAAQKPAAYRAFEQMAVRSSPAGTQIGLPNSMCLDRHVHDFLMCLRCWLPRTFGEPQTTGRPWRLQCLDLSRNSLSDESICRVMDFLKSLDVRLERLLLAGNRTMQRGLAAITEYIWNCREALLEIDLADNEIYANPKAGPTPGSDVVSAFLRCIYNHGAYPVTVDAGREGVKVLPLLLRMGGNGIVHPEKLLKQIRTVGGKTHVRVCASADAYAHTAKEYLSVCLPDFLVQRALENGAAAHSQPLAAPIAAAPVLQAAPMPAPVAAVVPEASVEKGSRRKRSRSGGREPKKSKQKKERGRRRDAAPAATPEAAAAGVADPAAVAQPPTGEGAGTDGGNGGVADEGEKVPDVVGREGDGRWRPGRGSRSRSASSDSSRRRNGRRSSPPQPLGLAEGQVLAQADDQPDPSYRAPTEEEQKQLQSDVDAQLQAMGGMPSEQATRDMLAEFVVCMVVARKPMSALASELRTFMNEHEPRFMEWFQGHIRQHFGQ